MYIMSNIGDIIYREIRPDEVPVFVDKFGDYIVKFNCFHFGNGCFSLAAFKGEEPVGFISAHSEPLISPLANKYDAFIDVIEVDSNCRRKGIAKKMIELIENWAKNYGYRQIRSWSSDDKKEAVFMWYALGYCVCPAVMYGEDLSPNEDGSKPVGYYVAKMLNTGTHCV